MHKILFFDFDGVIVDSFDAALEVHKMIRPLTTAEIYRKRFEGNINESFNDEDTAEIYNKDIDFTTEYIPRLLKCPLFPGMIDVVKAVAQQSKLIIVSSTDTVPIKKFLTLHGIDSCFEEVMGNDIHKGKIAKIEMALGKYGVAVADCLFITDTLGDIKEAHHVGVPTIAVSWGYQPRETLEKGNPSRIVETSEELLEAIEG